MTMPRPRFSLRTLLVVLTVACGALGYIAWNLREISERRRVAAWIERHGGSLDRRDSPSGHFNKPPLPYIQTLLGENAYLNVVIPADATRDDAQYVKSLFPES